MISNDNENSKHSEIQMGVEPCEGGYWSYYDRSPGKMPEASFHSVLKWFVQQISLGHFASVTDEDNEVVGLVIGQDVPFPAEVNSLEKAEHHAIQQQLGLNIAGVIAEAKERGTSSKTIELEKLVWDKSNSSAKRRMEMHYALHFSQLLGRMSKKLPKLDLMPILDKAPESTRDYLAEATRCYLFMMNRACIALCRACLEDSLKEILTPQMQADWKNEISNNKTVHRNPNPMYALVSVCAKYGKLGNLENDAHFVREQGNSILHLKDSKGSESAEKVLFKTRAIVSHLYS